MGEIRRGLCLITVDGTDFRVYEPGRFDRTWYSHKFKCAGLRWEVAISIYSGDIVWISGPYRCGSNPDLKIFRQALKGMLALTSERCEADGGYRGEPGFVNLPTAYNASFDDKQDVRSRHETVNRRFKQFNILHRVFRHDRQRHDEVFTAVAVITQLAIENGTPLYGAMYTPTW